MALPKIDTSTRVADQVFESLLTAIVSGDVAEGQRLRIRDLAQQLGTSEMPVREAIRRLEEAGLAQAAPYRGAAVKKVTRDELLELYAVRRMLEVEAARLGAAAVTDATVQAMEADLERLETAIQQGHRVQYLDRDEQLLTRLYDAAGNAVLTETIRSLWLRCRAYKLVGATQEFDRGEPEALAQHQRHLVAAARTRDAELAARATAESLDAAIERIRGALDR